MAAGITPANELAKAGELEIDPNNGGIVVNPELQIRSDLYAVCRNTTPFLNPALFSSCFFLFVLLISK